MSLAPELHMEKHYVDGYVPASFDAPHSSLHRSITWIGMGCILSSLAGFGFMAYAFGEMLNERHDSPVTLLIIGAVFGFGMLFTGFGCIHAGRKNYREYKERSGRIQ